MRTTLLWGWDWDLYLLLGDCGSRTGDSVWACRMLWIIAVTSRFSWRTDVSQTLHRPCWYCLYTSRICNCSVIFSTEKFYKINVQTCKYLVLVLLEYMMHDARPNANTLMTWRIPFGIITVYIVMLPLTLRTGEIWQRIGVEGRRIEGSRGENF